MCALSCGFGLLALSYVYPPVRSAPWQETVWNVACLSMWGWAAHPPSAACLVCLAASPALPQLQAAFLAWLGTTCSIQHVCLAFHIARVAHRCPPPSALSAKKGTISYRPMGSASHAQHTLMLSPADKISSSLVRVGITCRLGSNVWNVAMAVFRALVIVIVWSVLLGDMDTIVNIVLMAVRSVWVRLSVLHVRPACIWAEICASSVMSTLDAGAVHQLGSAYHVKMGII